MGERRIDLSTNQYQGAIYPRGFERLTSFRIDPFPVFIFEVEGILHAAGRPRRKNSGNC